MPRTINQVWTHYLKTVVPSNAPPVQLEECRRAFYGGAAAVFNILTREVVKLDDDGAERELEKMEAELDEFLAAFMRKHGP